MYLKNIGTIVNRASTNIIVVNIMGKTILERYETAKDLMQGMLSNQLVLNDAVFPHWVEGSNYFWYRKETKPGSEYRLVNSDTGENTLLFDHGAVSQQLGEAVGRHFDNDNLFLDNLKVVLDPIKIFFDAGGSRWIFSFNDLRLEQDGRECLKMPLYSPDNQKAVFVSEYNLWLKDMSTGFEEPLTTDGTEDFNYAGALMGVDKKIQACWSPDSNYIFSVQLDTRKVRERPHIQYASEDGSMYPKLTQTKLAYPGDDYVETYRLIVIDLSKKKSISVNYHALPLIIYGAEFFGFFNGKPLGWWAPDSESGFFIDISRGAKKVRVVEFEASSGLTTVLFEETSDTFVNIQNTIGDVPMFLPIPQSNELIWFSERTGWGHLYLYDLNTGELKGTITSGSWLVRGILHFCSESREIIIQTAGRNSQVSPYYRDICKVNIDTGVLTTLLSGNTDYHVYHAYDFTVNHRCMSGLDTGDVSGVSPCGQYIVTTCSRVDVAPVSLLIGRDGREISKVECADVTRLPTGWHWPEPIILKGADNCTDICGVMYRPSGFSPEVSYPVIDFSGGLRYYESVPHGSFVNGPCFGYNYFLGAALAELGFIVIAVEARGTPNRGKAFQDHNYGDASSTSDFNDRISLFRKLAKKYDYLDLDRVGITGIDGLANTIYGLLNHPNFYKVGVMHCYYESRYSFSMLGEIYGGISVDTETLATSSYVEDNVNSLKAKLLLTQGMLDFATPASTFRLVDALHKANKDFDMLCLTSANHSLPDYALRRTWDYLVKNLLYVNPPIEFQLESAVGRLASEAGRDYD